MFYEQRMYEAQPARLGVLVRRFAEVNVPLFGRHGFRPVGYCNPHRVVYLLAWDSWEERDRSWAAFYADADWQQSMEQSGSTVDRITSSILKPLPFSPLQ